MTTDARTLAAILDADKARAEARAEASVIAESCELAPLSYADLKALPAGGLGAALVNLPDELVRAQAIRLLAERGKATGRFWGWGDVDTLEAWLAAQIAQARAAALAARVGAETAQRIADLIKETPMETATPVAPTAAQVEAALLALEEDAARRERYARDGGDVDAAKLAAREAQACRDAAALVLDGAYKVTSAGDLLVKSPRGMWHRVGRRPADGDGYAPILCSCEWGQKSNGIGPCKHQALWEGYHTAADAALAERDDATPLPFDPADDPAYLDSLMDLDPARYAA